MKLLATITVLVSLFEYCHVAPAFGDAFQLGTEQTYNYVNEVRAGSAANASLTVGCTVRAKVHLATVWGDDEHKLLRIKIEDPTLYTTPGDVKRETSLSSASEAPFYVYWNLGYVKTIYLKDKENDVSLSNFRKGVAALFQYQILDGKYVEEDPSGKCDVQYTSHSTTRYHKAKNNCKFAGDRYERTEYPLRSLIRNSRSTDFTVSTEGTLEKVVAQDYLKYLVNAYDNLGAFVESITRLDIEGRNGKVATLEGKTVTDAVKPLSVKSFDLLSEEYESESGVDAGLVKLIKDVKKSLTNERIGKHDSSSALLQLIQAGRRTKTEDFARILKAKTMKDQQGQLLDLLGAIQTEESHEAAKTLLVYENDEDLYLAERYLQALAVGSRPRKTVIEDLLATAEQQPKNDKFFDTLVQTVASLAHRYAKLPGNSFDTELVEKVKDFLLNQLERCKKDKCKLKFVRGLHNLKSPKTLDSLTKLALEGSPKISVAAMKALRSFSVFLWNDDFKAIFEEIFFQVSKKYDSSARALALDILLDLKPDMEELTHLIQHLKSYDKVYEVKQYLLQKLRMLADRCPDFAEMLRKVVQRDPKLNNYHVLVPRGLSTALSRTYSKVPSFNASLESLQEMSGGVLKRGVVDLALEVGEEKFSMFTLGLFAGGLSSFVSSGEDVDNEDESAMAGMELTVQGSVLRPLVFFDGKGELMGHVWSGTASEPTPAYQATTLLQDNEERYALQNGAILQLSTLGAISIDLNGQVTMSIWGRNAQSKVEQNTGIALQGSLLLQTSFVKLTVEFDVNQEPQLHLSSDLDFSSDTSLCMKLMQSDSVLNKRTVKTLSIPSTKYRKVQTTSSVRKIPGQTHALNQKNNDMCNAISRS